jgi:hypothetical protein
VEFYTYEMFLKYASCVTRISDLICLKIGVVPLLGWKQLTIEFDQFGFDANLVGNNYMHSELTLIGNPMENIVDSFDMYLSPIYLTSILEQQHG